MTFVTRLALAGFLCFSGTFIQSTVFTQLSDIQVHDYSEEQDLHNIEYLYEKNRCFLNRIDDASFKDFIETAEDEPFIKTAHVNSEFAGFITYNTYHVIRDGAPVLLGNISMLAVEEKFRRKSIGKILLTTAIEDLKQEGCLEVGLRAYADNMQAIKFYKKNGFTDEGQHRKLRHFCKNLVSFA